MSDQDTYTPGPNPSPMDRLSPLEERMQHEAKLVYDEVLPEVYGDIFGDERMPPSKLSRKPRQRVSRKAA